MKFSAKTDINAGLNAAFAGIADFDAYERFALRAGAEITRVDALTTPGPGLMWALRIVFRGKVLKINIELMDYDPPNMLQFTGGSDGYEADVRVELMALSARETRVTVSADVKPKTLAARLVLQSARLTKGALNKRFRRRIVQFGTELESRVRNA
jgi:hypothetical protein